MSASDAGVVALAVDTDRYPLADPGSSKWKSMVSRVRQELQDVGCTVVRNFIRPSMHETLRQEGERLAPLAYCRAETVNVYNIAVDSSLPEDHPGRITMPRGNAFVAHDQFDVSSIINQLYSNQLFQRFVASCFELPRLHELADPLSSLVLNIVKPGLQHPWHFDTNEFTVSLMTQEPQAGGLFEYCPNIRSARAENFEGVRSVLERSDGERVRKLRLRPGDLQLFKGRYSLHRVSEVIGESARHTAIFAYSERPGVIGSVSRTKQLFGRVLPVHLATEGRVRVDQLLD